MFFRFEKSRALLTFLCVCLPLSIEISSGIRMQSIISWEIIIPTFAYMLLAFQATRCFDKHNFQIYVELCRLTLTIIVFHSWLSIIYNMKTAIVNCVLETSLNDNYLIECKKYGLVKNCIEGISHINRMNSARTKCPTSILGSTLGGWYMLLVILFRFIPTGIYGLWNLYTWNPERFARSGSCGTTEEKEKHVVPSGKILSICTVILLPCLLGEISVSNIKPLSSINCIHFFVAIIIIQNSVHGCSADIKSALLYVQRLCFYSGVIFLFVDLCQRSMEIIMTCFTGNKVDEYLKDTCTHSYGVRGIEQCYMALSDVDPYYFLKDGCPTSFFRDIQTAILYCSNIAKVVVFSVGLLMSFSMFANVY